MGGRNGGAACAEMGCGSAMFGSAGRPSGQANAIRLTAAMPLQDDAQ
jgi:hypothetical protein